MNETNERMNGNASQQTDNEKIAHQIHSHTHTLQVINFIYLFYLWSRFHRKYKMTSTAQGAQVNRD